MHVLLLGSVSSCNIVFVVLSFRAVHETSGSTGQRLHVVTVDDVELRRLVHSRHVRKMSQ